MRDHHFRLLNVFTTGDTFSGNPLCVFEDGRGLSDGEMQALALQFNLSETTFIFRATTPEHTARVRIWTPAFEMPFAGHPTLGTAFVVRDLLQAGDEIALDMRVGKVEVTARGARWTLRAAKVPETRVPAATREDLAAMLGVPADAILAPPLWVDTGADQLVVPLATVAHVNEARPRSDLLARHGFSDKRGASMVYAWAPGSDGEIVARFFFIANGNVIEDPATGSACANLGGWMIAARRELPLRLRIRQGDAVRRPSILNLEVDAEKRIFVGGDVVEIGRGTVSLPQA